MQKQWLPDIFAPTRKLRASAHMMGKKFIYEQQYASLNPGLKSIPMESNYDLVTECYAFRWI